MRILDNNKVNLSDTITTASIYENQRIFHGAVTNGPFVATNTVTGGTSGATGTITFVDPNDGWIDVLLPNDIDFFNPNQYQETPSVELLTSGSTTATTVLNTDINFSGRPVVSHPDFPSDNINSLNRNLITPAKSYQDNLERNFHYLKFNVVFAAAENISCLAIVGHNLTSAASIEVHVMNGATQVYTDTIVNPNRVVTTAGSKRAIDTGSVRAATNDSNNVFIMYFDTTYAATHLEIDINDSTTTESYIYIGKLYVGEYWAPSSTTYYGWSTTIVDTSSVVYAQSPYSIERPKYHMMDLLYQNLTGQELDDWKYLRNWYDGIKNVKKRKFHINGISNTTVRKNFNK